MRDEQCEDGRIVVAFVHGLGGEGEATWRTGDHESLPDRVARLTGADVLCYEYPTSAVRVNPFRQSPPDVQLLATGLATELDLRAGDADAIVLACHSLGGLVARKMLVEQMQDGHDPRVRHLALLATPNRGSRLAWWGELFSFRHRQLRQLMSDSEFLGELERDWEQTGLDERLPTTVLYGGLDRVVGPGSARLSGAGFEVDPSATHSTIVKPTSDDAASVRLLAAIVASVCDELDDGPHATREASPEGDAASTGARVGSGELTPAELHVPSPALLPAPDGVAQIDTSAVDPDRAGAAPDLPRALVGAGAAGLLAFTTPLTVLQLTAPELSTWRLVLMSLLCGLGAALLAFPLIWWYRHHGYPLAASVRNRALGGGLALFAVAASLGWAGWPEEPCCDRSDITIAVSPLAVADSELDDFAEELHGALVARLESAEFEGDVDVIVPDEVLDESSGAAWAAEQDDPVAATVYGRVEPSSANGNRVIWGIHASGRAASSVVPLALSEQFGRAQIITQQQLDADELGASFTGMVDTLRALVALDAGAPEAARRRILDAKLTFAPDEDFLDAQIPDVVWALDTYVALVQASQDLDRTGVAGSLDELGDGLRVDPRSAGSDDVDSDFALATLLAARYLELFPATTNVDSVPPCPGTPEADLDDEAFDELFASVDDAALSELAADIESAIELDRAPVLTAGALGLQARVRGVQLARGADRSIDEVVRPLESLIAAFGSRPELDLDVWVSDAHALLAAIEPARGRPYDAVVEYRRAAVLASPFFEAQALADTGVVLTCSLSDGPDGELARLGAACHFRDASEKGTGLSGVGRDLLDEWIDRSEPCTLDAASISACLISRAAQRAETSGLSDDTVHLRELYDDYVALVGGVQDVPGWCGEAPVPTT